jgi:hypothetical protein
MLAGKRWTVHACVQQSRAAAGSSRRMEGALRTHSKEMVDTGMTG